MRWNCTILNDQPCMYEPNNDVHLQIQVSDPPALNYQEGKLCGLPHRIAGKADRISGELSDYFEEFPFSETPNYMCRL